MNTNMNGLSADIRRYAYRRLLIRICATAAWFAAWTVAMSIYMNQWGARSDMKMLIFTAALSIIGIFLFGLPKMLINGTVEGVVIERSVTEAFAPFTRDGDDESTRMIQIFKIRLDDGKTVTQRSPNREDFIIAFAVGTRVRRYRLLRVPEPLDGEFAGRICLACGGTERGDGICTICGKTIK